LKSSSGRPCAASSFGAIGIILAQAGGDIAVHKAFDADDEGGPRLVRICHMQIHRSFARKRIDLGFDG
jgi:hypothetical protein